MEKVFGLRASQQFIDVLNELACFGNETAADVIRRRVRAAAADVIGAAITAGVLPADEWEALIKQYGCETWEQVDSACGEALATIRRRDPLFGIRLKAGAAQMAVGDTPACIGGGTLN